MYVQVLCIYTWVHVYMYLYIFIIYIIYVIYILYIYVCIHLFFISIQKFRQSPRKSLIY